MRYLILLIVLLCYSDVCRADFEFSIDGCYDFVSCNSIETCICLKNGTVVFSPMLYRGIGPVKYYAKTGGHLVLQTMGRGTLPGNGHETHISTDEWYFVIDYADDRVEGPISKSDFYSDSRFKSGLNWQSTIHPLGYLLMALISILGLCMLGVSGWLIWKRMSPAA